MTTTIAYPEAEPTLHDVIQIMEAGFARVDERFDAMNLKFETELHEVKHRLFKLELKFEDKSDTVLNHEERLVDLERWRKGLGKKGLAGA